MDGSDTVIDLNVVGSVILFKLDCSIPKRRKKSLKLILFSDI